MSNVRTIADGTGSLNGEELSKYLGTSYMLQNKALFEPGRTSDFILKIKFKRDLYDMDGNLVMGHEEASEALALSLRNYNGPEMSISPIEIRTGNGQMKYAGAPSISDSSITFTDYIGQKTEQILLAWYTMAHNVQNDKIGFKEYYGQDGILYKWAPNGTRQISWKLLGCWINTYSLGAFDRSNPDQRQISTNIVYDKAIPWQTPDYDSWFVDTTMSKNNKPTVEGTNPYSSTGGSNYIGTLGKPTAAQIAEGLQIN